jgi:formate hydrogenlyase subunit 6/NADH:ubiquinone oxidoreductase subunit I
MRASLRGLATSFRWLFRRTVTAQYPDRHLAVQERYMGFPALLWDETADEPFCTGCMVCVRECPTQCMSAQMHDNPHFAEGSSHRRKIIENFSINLNRCILCGVCAEVCALDAIEMSHEHELASYARAGARADLTILLSQGRRYMAETGWSAKNPEKNVAGVALEKAKQAAAAKAAAAAAKPAGDAQPTPEGEE